MNDDDLPDRPEWGDVSPSIGADLLAAARRREDLRVVALAYRYAGRFTGDDVLRTAIAVNALSPAVHPRACGEDDFCIGGSVDDEMAHHLYS
jgi:hypothetical protein